MYRGLKWQCHIPKSNGHVLGVPARGCLQRLLAGSQEEEEEGEKDEDDDSDDIFPLQQDLSPGSRLLLESFKENSASPPLLEETCELNGDGFHQVFVEFRIVYTHGKPTC